VTSGPRFPRFRFMRKMTAKKAEEGSILPIKRRILEVSDEEVLREIIAAICKRRGFDVIQARCGDEALRLYRKSGPFALVLCDLYWYDKIPEPPLSNAKAIRHGIQLASAIRRIAPKQKMVIHTGAFQVREQMPEELDDVPILSKPFRMEELESSLENL
jgi:CheY-like chemotaxis protein